ncbi:kelch domain-containing protein 10-like [Penaeus chinensis]|uniref:kelch domain-containing protein 10-like n=1 Tax=Penaeus chinensis TaxID=139456 RepID=UPI001FB7F0EF|nr:kelch domain-containing protein 10-like [Penaeus chinensis]
MDFQDNLMEEIQTWASEGCTPTGRSGHRISCTESFLFCVGGYHPDHGPLQDVWRLNLSTGEWEKLSSSSSTPGETVSHCLVSTEDELLLFGGTSFPFGSSIGVDVHACDKRTGEWRALESHGETPPALYGQASRRVGDYVYTVGGTSGYHFSLHAHALHLPTGTWSSLATNDLFKGEEPSGRYRAEIGVVPGRIVVVGGAAASSVYPLDEVPVLDVDTGKWAVKKTNPDPLVHAHPSPRRCHAAVQRGKDLYIIGGTDGTEIFDDVWKLDLHSLSWARLALVLPRPLYFHDAAVTPVSSVGLCYGRGGGGERVFFLRRGPLALARKRSSSLFRARLDAPPLLEAAWESFASHCPTIITPLPASVTPSSATPTAHDFLAAGVPRRLMQRLVKLH